MPIESKNFLENQVSCNFMLNYYIAISLWQFTKTLNQVFYLPEKNKNLEIYMPVWLEQLNELKQFWGTFIK